MGGPNVSKNPRNQPNQGHQPWQSSSLYDYDYVYNLSYKTLTVYDLKSYIKIRDTPRGPEGSLASDCLIAKVDGPG